MSNKDKEKEKFFNYCKMFNAELKDTKNSIEEDYSMGEIGTLKDLGEKYSFELANIGFELGYASWVFLINGTLKEVINSFCDTIMENERIESIYTDIELKKIKDRIERIGGKNGRITSNI